MEVHLIHVCLLLEKAGMAISIDHFDLIRVIGRGSYAKVLMVELKETKRLYAMKVIKKELVTDDEVSFFMTSNLCILEYPVMRAYFNQFYITFII